MKAVLMLVFAFPIGCVLGLLIGRGLGALFPNVLSTRSDASGPRMMHGRSRSGLTTDPSTHPWEPECAALGCVDSVPSDARPVTGE